MRRTRTGVIGVGAVVAGMAIGSAGAQAATAQWACGGSVVRTTAAGGEPVDPIRAQQGPCSDAATGVPKLTDAVGLAPAVRAQTAYVITGAQPAGGRPITQTVAATTGVEGLALSTADGTVVLGVTAARSTATANCANNAAVPNGSSEVTGLTINGQTVSADGPLTGLTDAISGSPLGALVSVRLNEQVKDANGLVQRAAHVTVLAAAGTPLADVVVAESRVSSASACDPNADGNKDPTPPATTAAQSLGQVCPAGSILDIPRTLCVIPASASGGQGITVVGPPFSGPSGGRVVALPIAKRRFKSPCLSGPGPKFVVVGTNGRDRITGTNRRDRILGLGGNDSLDGGREVDCLDGAAGRDRLSGGIGSDRVYGGSGSDTALGGADKDRMYGQTGNDHVNGGSGSDLLDAGSGNDSINAGFGADRVLAGSGNDAINVATQGPRARVSCGTGFDKVRANRKERPQLIGCERQYLLNDR